MMPMTSMTAEGAFRGTSARPEGPETCTAHTQAHNFFPPSIHSSGSREALVLQMNPSQRALSACCVSSTSLKSWVGFRGLGVRVRVYPANFLRLQVDCMVTVVIQIVTGISTAGRRKHTFGLLTAPRC